MTEITIEAVIQEEIDSAEMTVILFLISAIDRLIIQNILGINQ